MGFSFHKSRKGGEGIQFVYEQAPSVTIADGFLCDFGTDGKLKAVASQTARPQAVLKKASTSTANGGERAETLDIGWSDTIWSVPFVPQLNGVVAQAGGSASVIRVLSDAAYNADDWKGGTVYIKELGLIATITASGAPSGAGQNLDLTITSAIKPQDAEISGMNGLFATGAGKLLSGDPVGNTIYATPLGRDVLAAKLKASTFDTISQVIADQTGGFAQIMGVGLSNYTNPFLLVCFTN